MSSRTRKIKLSAALDSIVFNTTTADILRPAIQNEDISGTSLVQNEDISGTSLVQNEDISGTSLVQNEDISGTSLVQNEDISGTSLVQNEDISGTSLVQNEDISGTSLVQNEDISGTSLVQNEDISGTSLVQNEDISGTSLVQNEDISGTSLVQNEDISGTSLVQNEDISGTFLGSLSRNILFFLYENLTDKKKYITEKIHIPSLSSKLQVSVNTVRQSIRRMKKKNILKTTEYSTSRLEGFAQFEINKAIIKKVKSLYIYNSNNINTNTTIKKEAENYNTEKATNQNSNTSSQSTFISNNSKELTNSLQTQNTNVISKSELTNKANEKLKYEELPEEWKSINYHFLDDLHFKQHHIVGLYKLDVLEPEVVQESIEHFAYGIKHNPDSYKKYTDPLKVFYGSLRKGKPWTESTYKSTKEMATEDLIQRRKTEKRKIANETCKLVESIEKESYEKWHFSLSEEEKKEIKEKHKLQESGIYNVFDDKIYKLHYGKYVMEEYKDPSELALEEFIAKKKRREEEEAKRIKKMLQEGAMIKEYYKWAGELKEEEIQEITEEEGGMTEKGQNKMIIYYAKKIVI